MTAVKPVDWSARCNLARSILDQREPSFHTVQIARMALEGRSIDYIRRYEDSVAAWKRVA